MAEQTVGSGSAIPTIPPGRGTFGFEFELHVPFTAGTTYAEIREPKGVKAAVARQRTLGFSLKIDHQPKLSIFAPVSHVAQLSPFKQQKVVVAWAGTMMSIPEVVTDVLTDRTPAADVEHFYTGIANWALELQKRVSAGRVSLADLDHGLAAYETAPHSPVEDLANVFIGPIDHPQGVNESTRGQATRMLAELTVSAYLHQTYALPLHRVPDEFGYLLRACGPTNQGLFVAPLKVTAAGENVDKALATLGHLDPAAAADLRGYLFLLQYYAVALSSKDTTGGLGKSNPALLLFYKTDLKNLRARLLVSHPSLSAVLADGSRMGLVAAYLTKGLATPQRAQYVRELLDGTGNDTIFTGFKNEYSEELVPGEGALGVVVENRRLVEMQAPADSKRYAPAEWPALAVALHQRVTAHWHG